jgi:ankyrin repeat protein
VSLLIPKSQDLGTRDREFINSKESGSGNTALHFACRNGHLDVIQHLLENGADINSRNHFQNTPLFLAIESLNRAASQAYIPSTQCIAVKP